MRSRGLLSVLFLAVAVLLYTPAGTAQTGPHSGSDISLHGVPASVTSFGFGGSRGFHGVPASVTSPNFGNAPFRPHPGFGFGHHHRNHAFVNPFYGGYYVPYSYPGYVMEPGVDDSMEMDYAAPPNSDRSGPDPREEVRHELDALRSTVEDYRAELRSDRRAELGFDRKNDQREAKPDEQQPAASQPKTILVFRDGHQLEIVNYAIVGGTLYDLSEGRTKKVELAELDLTATVKQNGDRGVDFQLPAGVKLN